MPVEFDIDFLPPSDNAKMRGGRGRMFLSPEARAFYEDIQGLVKRLALPCTSGWVVIEIDVHLPPDMRRRDPSNFLKMLLDGMQKANLLEDDCYALPRIMRVTRHGPGLGIRIRQAEPHETPQVRDGAKPPASRNILKSV